MTTEQNLNSQLNDINEDGISIDIRRYFYLFWQWAWLIILLGVISAGSAYFISRRSTPVFETSTEVLVIAAPDLQTTTYNSILTSQNLVPTYADLLTNESILIEVINRLGLTKSTSSLTSMITVGPVRDTSSIKISIDGSDRGQIALIGNTLVEVFIEKLNTLQSNRFTNTKENLQNELSSIDNQLKVAIADEAAATDPTVKNQLDSRVIQYRSMYATVLTSYEQARIAEVQGTSSVVQIDKAGNSYLQISPKTLTNTLLSGIMGFLLGFGFVFARDALDNTIKSTSEISRNLKLPVLGVISTHMSKDYPVTQTDPRATASDSFRSLRTNLKYVDVDHPIRSIMVTSPMSGEGKTTVSTNLAIVLAQAANRVTILDVNFHRPLIHERLHLSNTRGLTNLLGRPLLHFDDIKQKTAFDGLSAITIGDVIPLNTTELLASKKMEVAINVLMEDDGMVILDAPRVLGLADSIILAKLVDGVLLVIQPGLTTLQAAKQAVENLRRVNARVIGVVLNNTTLNSSEDHYYSNIS